jgi:methyl-accepting chemotaxis protein
MSESSERLDRIEKMVESNAKAILALANEGAEDRRTLTEQIRAVGEGANRTNEAVISLVSVIERQQESLKRHDEAIQSVEEGTRSTNAAIERMDRILDYLMRREQGQG